MNIEKIMAVDTGRYGLKLDEVMEMLTEVQSDIPRGLVIAFQFGFMRGQRAEKARAKKKAVKA